AVAGGAEIVPSFPRCGFALSELAGLGPDSPRQPVREDAAGGVGVVDDERELMCGGRHVVPGERRRDVLAVARVPDGNRLAASKSGAGQLQGPFTISAATRRSAARDACAGARRGDRPRPPPTAPRSQTCLACLLPPSGRQREPYV